MSKVVLALVRDEDGITVEVRARSIPDCQALMSQAAAAVVAVAALDAAPSAAVSGRCCSTVGANGQFLSVLGSLIQKAAAELPTILPYILQLLPLFATKQDSTAVGESVGANGQILSALAKFLQFAATELPVILPEILQLIALLGGNVQVAPVPSNA